ncbi:MAG TPA: hypothetical protein VJS64_13015 [Pyrinomonadaceae bacterium]|nr:hypothetical protein [Pyrinomonadaceae bacterium]
MHKSFVKSAIFCCGLISFGASTTVACTRAYPFRLGELFSADLIVRATAIKYQLSPKPDAYIVPDPESTIEFKVEEPIWGANVPKRILLNGYLNDQDDFNDVPLPYRFVRPSGREGACHTHYYKKGAQYLLFVKRSDSLGQTTTGFTVRISGLGPTNEQLRGPNDPWVKWVKAYLSPCARQENHDADYADRSRFEFRDFLAQRQPDLEKYRIAKCYLVKYGTKNKDATAYLDVIESFETIPTRKNYYDNNP